MRELRLDESAESTRVTDDWVSGEELLGFDVSDTSPVLNFRGLPFRFCGSVGWGGAVAEEVSVFGVDDASLDLDFRGRPLRFRGSTDSGRIVGVETFCLDGLDSVGLSASPELDGTNARLRGTELEMLGGVAGGVPSSESDESPVDQLGGSGVTWVLRLLLLVLI